MKPHRVTKHRSTWSEPPRKVPCNTATDAPLLGNGDLGICIGGPPEEQGYWIAKNDFWKMRSRHDATIRVAPTKIPTKMGTKASATRPLTPDTRHLTPEIITANWPRGCIGIDIDTGAVRPVCSFNAWHPSINRQGTLMCADTVFPDIGLQLFDPRDGVGQPRTLCFPGATNEGKHWDTDHCPYDDEDYKQGKWKVYAPQHTHPHPSFSPDGRLVIFTSDRTGHSQVYEVEVECRRD